MASDWMNKDGLYIKFGAKEAEPAHGGEYQWDGPLTTVEFDIDFDRLEAYGTATFLSDTVTIPNGVRLEKAELYVETAFTSGGSATLDLGLYDTDRATAYDADGIDAAIPVGSLTAGARIQCDGALVGTTLANNTPSLVAATVGTANFTAGKAKLRLYYYVV